jgi:hypothetical protein
MASKDQAALKAVEGEEHEEVEVDIDLDEMQDQLHAEAVGKATTVRIDGKVIHIMHAGDWTSTAYRAMMNGDFDTWAQEAILDERELKVWQDADLRLFEMEAVVTQCARTSRLGLGKSRKSSGSSRRTRRR